MTTMTERSQLADGFNDGSAESHFEKKQEGLSGLLEAQYDSFHEWLVQSIDVIRNELLPLDFVLFAICYFDLLQNDQSSSPVHGESNGNGATGSQVPKGHRAQQFLQRFGKLHILSHEFELDYMASNPQEFSRRLKRKRPALSCSWMSKELLLSFLRNHQQLLSIVNSSIVFTLQERLVGTATPAVMQLREADMMASVLNGADDANRTYINDQVVKWAVPKRIRAALGSDAAAFVAPDKEPSTTSQLWKTYIEKLTGEPPEVTEAASGTTSLPAAKKLKQQDLKWPSIAMMSVFNSVDGLISFSSGTLQSSARVVAGGFEDSTARVWTAPASGDSQTFGQRSAVLVGHSQPVYGVSVQGSKVLTCSGDGTVRLWIPTSELTGSVGSTYDSDEYRNVCVWETAKDVPIWAVQFAPFGGYFVTGGRDGSARIWAVDAPGKHLRYLYGHMGDVDCVAFHPNAHYVFTGSADKTVRMWDVQTGKCCRIFVGHSNAVESLAVHPAGKFLCSGGTDGLIIVWDVATGKRLRVWDMTNQHQMAASNHRAVVRDVVYSLAWSPDGKFLAASVGTSPTSTVVVFGIGINAEDSLLSGGDETSMPSAVREFQTKCDPVVHLSFVKADVILATGVYQSSPS